MNTLTKKITLLEWVLWDEGRTIRMPFNRFLLAYQALSYARELYRKGEREYMPTLTLKVRRGHDKTI